MRTLSRMIGVLTALAWGIIFVICAISVVRTNTLAHTYSILLPYAGYSFDPAEWKFHWLFTNLCIMVFAVVGCLGAWKLWRLQSKGFLLLSISALLWFVLVASLALLHFDPYRFERMGIYAKLELLGIAFVFLLLLLFFASRRKLSVAAGAQ
jgi:hypothetical protein